VFAAFREYLSRHLSAGAAIRPLLSAILSRSMYPSVYLHGGPKKRTVTIPTTVIRAQDGHAEFRLNCCKMYTVLALIVNFK